MTRTMMVAWIVLAALPAVASAGNLSNVRFGSRQLKQGMTGTDVQTLQRDLTSLGWFTSASGRFNHWTAVHVQNFQRRVHLQADGVVGPATYQKLKTAMVTVEEKGAKPTPGTTTSTATTSSAALPADDSGGAGFVPANNSPNGPVENATLQSNGLVAAPANAPQVIQEIIQAANKIAFDPYIYGGGHNGWGPQSGYDCSGSVSYALHGGGLLNGQPLDSTQFESYGDAGSGKWITLFANGGHVLVQIAGLWFDTAAQSSSNGNDRWTQTRISPASGFVVRHPNGW